MKYRMSGLNIPYNSDEDLRPYFVFQTPREHYTLAYRLLRQIWKTDRSSRLFQTALWLIPQMHQALNSIHASRTEFSGCVRNKHLTGRLADYRKEVLTEKQRQAAFAHMAEWVATH